MAHSPKGFTGTVDQVAEARRFAMATAPFRVASAADWAVTLVGGADRAVQIAAGTGQVCGVLDITNVAETVQFAANATGATRYDALVARFDWTSLTVAFAVVQGTATPPAVTSTTADPTKINRIPGVLYDALIGVQAIAPGVGTFPAGSFTDCRAVGGRVGQLISQAGSYSSLTDLVSSTEVSLEGTLRRSDGQNIINAGTSGSGAEQGLTRFKIYPTAGKIIGPWNVEADGRGASTLVPGCYMIEQRYGDSYGAPRFVEPYITGTATRSGQADTASIGFGSMGGTHLVEAPTGLTVLFNSYTGVQPNVPSDIVLRDSFFKIRRVGPAAS